MENRVARFYELHNNKWFHIMNATIDVIRMIDKKEKCMLIIYGMCFYEGMSYGLK